MKFRCAISGEQIETESDIPPVDWFCIEGKKATEHVHGPWNLFMYGLRLREPRAYEVFRMLERDHLAVYAEIKERVERRQEEE